MDLFDGRRDAVHDLLDVAGEDATFGRQRDQLLAAVKELDAKLFLETADGVGHSRLRDVEPLRRAGEAAGLADHEKVFELSDFQNIPPLRFTSI